MAPVNRKRQIASKILRIHRPVQKSDEVDSSLYPHWRECSTCLIGLEDFYLSPLFTLLHSSIFGMINFPMLAGRNRHMALRNTTKFPAQANLHGISKKGSIPHERILVDLSFWVLWTPINKSALQKFTNLNYSIRNASYGATKRNPSIFIPPRLALVLYGEFDQSPICYVKPYSLNTFITSAITCSTTDPTHSLLPPLRANTVHLYPHVLHHLAPTPCQLHPPSHPSPHVHSLFPISPLQPQFLHLLNIYLTFYRLTKLSARRNFPDTSHLLNKD